MDEGALKRALAILRITHGKCDSGRGTGVGQPQLCTANAEIFAANRATGHLALRVAASAGARGARACMKTGSLRVRFPNAAGDALEAVIVNTGGGMTGVTASRWRSPWARGQGGRRHRGGGKDLSLQRAGTRRWTLGSRSATPRGSPGCRRRRSCSTAPPGAAQSDVALAANARL